jgi:hypothetical protein
MRHLVDSHGVIPSLSVIVSVLALDSWLFRYYYLAREAASCLYILPFPFTQLRSSTKENIRPKIKGSNA